MEAAGLRVLALTHFMAPLVPLLLGLRAVGRVLGRLGLGAASRRSLELRVTPVVNEVMAAVLAVEGWLIDAGLPMPFGSSLVAVAVRRS
jgi:hypothetical protein